MVKTTVALDDAVSEIDRQLESDFGYIITGLGRSGTTFLAHVFLQAGYNTGGFDSHSIGKDAPVGGGLEYPPFAKANMRLQYFALFVDPNNTSRNTAPAVFPLLMHQQWPDVMKDPRYLDTFMAWHNEGYIPKHIFLCVREPQQRDNSLQELYEKSGNGQKTYINITNKTYYCYYSVFNMLLYCQKYDIPHTIVLYPRIGQDREYAEKVLGPFIQDPWKVVQRTWDTKLLHHSDSEEATES